MTCKHFYYLVHHYQELVSPQLAARRSMDDCLSQLLHKPTLVLSLTTAQLNNNHLTNIPRDAVVLGAIASNVHANIHGCVTTEPGVIMASFSPQTTHVTPFYEYEEDLSWPETFIPEQGDNHIINVYVCGWNQPMTGIFISILKRCYPNAPIVGGTCKSSFISLESNNGTITQVEHGVFGIIARNMPIKSFLSQGVKEFARHDVPHPRGSTVLTRQ